MRPFLLTVVSVFWLASSLVSGADAQPPQVRINGAQGWRLRLIDSVQPLVWSVDGKRMDPSKPYDPDAPAYVPEVEVTSPCTD